MSKARIPRERARWIICVVGRAKASGLYWLLKVALPRMRGGRIVERGGEVVGILREVVCKEIVEVRNK